MHIARTGTLPKRHPSGLATNKTSDRLAQVRHFFLALCTRARRTVTTSVATTIALLAPGAYAHDHADVQIDTSYGRILLTLDEQRAPESVDNFLAYVDAGFYDGTLFHRVIEGFMIQGGGFTQSYLQKQTRLPIRNEADNGLSNRAYTISMARTNEPHSATSQFFINTVDNRNLDHTEPSARGWGYAVFGQVVDGFDVVDRISEAVTGRGGPFSRDVPKEPVIIESVTRLLPKAAPAIGNNPEPNDTAVSDESQASAAAAN
jgi:cyclophilin family peptidyl-prolyl cis-trans isomerase